MDETTVLLSASESPILHNIPSSPKCIPITLIIAPPDIDPAEGRTLVMMASSVYSNVAPEASVQFTPADLARRLTGPVDLADGVVQVRSDADTNVVTSV